MNRAQLEHIIRASCAIADDDELLIVGSQAILGQFPDAPAELLVSMEADVCPKNRPELADLVEGSIGELSIFHDTFGYYADGVGDPLPALPPGWQERLIPIRGPGTAGKTGWALEVHDLLVSKYVAHREKDLEYARVALQRGLADPEVLNARVAATAMDPALREQILARIALDRPG
jgi:hypothetical protein